MRSTGGRACPVSQRLGSYTGGGRDRVMVIEWLINRGN